jgi:hypothetical protein
MNTHIDMFATANDTDQFAVAVDARFGLFASKGAAVAAYESITKPGQHFDDSPFGACQLLPPGYVPMHYDGDDMTTCRLSERQPIDIAGYIAKRPARRPSQRFVEPPTTAQRLADSRTWASFWRDLAE